MTCAGLCGYECRRCYPNGRPRDMFTETRKSKHFGQWMFVFIRKGTGGVVPNHAPHMRKVMISRSKTGWHLHLTLTTLRTWNGYRSADFDFAFHPSAARNKRLQEAYRAKES